MRRMSFRRTPAASSLPPDQGQMCGGNGGACEECLLASSGHLELRSAHHEVEQTAHGRITRIGFSGFQILNEGIATRGPAIEESSGQKVHQFAWLLAQLNRHQLR